MENPEEPLMSPTSPDLFIAINAQGSGTGLRAAYHPIQFLTRAPAPTLMADQASKNRLTNRNLSPNYTHNPYIHSQFHSRLHSDNQTLDPIFTLNSTYNTLYNPRIHQCPPHPQSELLILQQ